MPNNIKKYDVDLINVYPALLYLFGYNILPPIPSIVLLKLVSISLYDTDSMEGSLSELWELVMDREAWRTSILGVAKSWTRLSN